MPYPWYEILKNSNQIRQGDFIPNCPIFVPPSNLNTELIEEGNEVDISLKKLNAIVVSQSCDLEHDKVEIVLVCPYYSLEYFFSALPISESTGNGRRKKIEALRQGNLPAYHLLNKDLDCGLSDYSVVDFKNVYGVNYDFLKSFVSSIPNRPRLLPPYREHLSQAFARFFMRVGLPNDIEGVI
ncbi:MAG: hypothetical protein KA713_15745 [Chryseotalea sp. WA131a]|jgi:hypothetical protein|nr:MAG: hypothetical protein KA713_15745 [Chryseotalea sp. WA131a]